MRGILRRARPRPPLRGAWLAGLLLALATITSACSSPTASAGPGTSSPPAAGTSSTPGGGTSSAPAALPAGAQQVTLTVGNSMRFEPSSFTVQAGQPVALSLQNTGQVTHDFTLTDGVAQPVKITAAAGQTAQGTFTIQQPGTYTFACSQPGHAAAGMRGTITAQPDPAA